MDGSGGQLFNLLMNLNVTESGPLGIMCPLIPICVLFDDGLSERCEVTSQCAFDFHFPDD